MSRSRTRLLGLLVLLVLATTAVGCGASRSSARGGVPAARSTPTTRPGSPAGTKTAPRPLLAVVGASFSAGVGAGNRRDAWPADLARIMHWRVVVSADPGAGYVKRGAGGRGPFARLAARLGLSRLHPELVIIQGGHDDIGRPLRLIRERVESLVTSIHRATPHSELAVLTVFTRGHRASSAALATDRTIVAAARRADPAVIVFDPIAQHWQFPRVRDRLHPSATGDRRIAGYLAAGLRTQLLNRAALR